MKFFLKINTANIGSFNTDIQFIEKNQAGTPEANRLIIFGSSHHTRVVYLVRNNIHAWFIGDPVFESGQSEQILTDLGASRLDKLLHTVGGHYRLVVFESSRRALHLASALFGILPVFYSIRGNNCFISGDLGLVSFHSGENRPNKRFVLENILFYYPLFNQTACKNIALLATNSFLTLTDKGPRVTKHTCVADWFVSEPAPWKKTIDQIAGLFIDRVRHYLPDEPYQHALTGGFDSRTLVACGLHYHKRFETYSFGNDLSNDAGIAAGLSKAAGVTYNQIRLDQDYVENQSLRHGLDFISQCNGTASFSRAHYLYAARSLSTRSRFLVTGNFGSEILRAAHNAGVVISPNLYHLFQSESLAEAIKKIEASCEFGWIDAEQIGDEWQSLKSDLAGMPVFSPDFSSLSLNARFYLFIFEETFRKYFGAEMVNQYESLNNRTPFLDSVFLKEMLKTALAGVYSEFFEHNPLKRYKGQLLYAYFIEKTYPPFSGMLTDKGYRPSDLQSVTGKLRILQGYLKKKTRRVAVTDDPYSVMRSYRFNLPFFKQIDMNGSVFNYRKISDTLQTGIYSDHLAIALSQAWFWNRHSQ